MRRFATGATRDDDTDKLDYEGFISPVVLHRFAHYMHRHRVQADGSLRASDNWQKGMPVEAYLKSLLRHTMDVWHHARTGTTLTGESVEDALCAVLFNAQGLLFERLRSSASPAPASGGSPCQHCSRAARSAGQSHCSRSTRP